MYIAVPFRMTCGGGLGILLSDQSANTFTQLLR